MNDDFEVMQLTVDIGGELLKNGARVYSVHQTMVHMLEAFGLKDYSLFVLSSGIWATLGKASEERGFSLRSIPSDKMHLGRTSKLYDLARVAAEEADRSKLDVYRKTLVRYANIKFYPHTLRNLACAFGSAGFCYMFDGNILDCLIAAICGFLVQALIYVLTKKSSVYYIPTMLGVALASILVTGLTRYFPVLGHDAIMTATIISLMPGVSFTTAIRDFFNGDHISGGVHMTDVILRAVCVAAGVGVGAYLWSIV